MVVPHGCSCCYTGVRKLQGYWCCTVVLLLYCCTVAVAVAVVAIVVDITIVGAVGSVVVASVVLVHGSCAWY